MGVQTPPPTGSGEPAGRSWAEGLSAASTELVLTLGAGEVKTASSGDTEHTAAARTLQQGGVLVLEVWLVLMLPDSELLTGHTLMFRRPR